MQITVKTVCRVHFGFLDLSGDLGRLYGSIGVALDNPRTIVKVTKAERLITENGSEKNVISFVERFSQHYQVQPTVRIQLKDSIPEHTGLGSGTQLALAVSTALAKICEIDPNGTGNGRYHWERKTIGNRCCLLRIRGFYHRFRPQKRFQRYRGYPANSYLQARFPCRLVFCSRHSGNRERFIWKRGRRSDELFQFFQANF